MTPVPRTTAGCASRTGRGRSSRRSGGSSRSGRGGGSGRGQGGGDDEREEGQQGPADRRQGAVGCRDRQRQEPGRPGQCSADVQSAEVVDLPERPADLQRPGRRGPSGQPEEEVDDVLLADDHGEGEVGERRVAEGPRRQGPSRPQEGQVGRDHQSGQPVVVHHPRVLQEPPRRGGEGWEVGRLAHGCGRHRATANRSSAIRSRACLSILPRSVSGKCVRAMTRSGTQ